MARLIIDIQDPPQPVGCSVDEAERLDVTHLVARRLGAADLQAPYAAAPGVIVLLPQSDSLNLAIDSQTVLLLPGLAYLASGVSEIRLVAEPLREAADRDASGILFVEINALINGAVPLREALSTPTQLGAVASEEVERLCEALAGNRRSLTLPAGAADVARHVITVQLLSLLLGAAGVGRLTANEQELDGRLVRLKQFMMARLDANPSVAEMARQLGMSRSCFCEWARPLLGDTPAHYMRKLRLEKSQELLRNSSLSIERIAEMTGFSSRHHLTREFARIYQTTPAKARRLARRLPAEDASAAADQLTREHRFAEALAVCEEALVQPAMAAHHDRLAYQKGRCLYALGHVEEGVAVWRSLRRGPWAIEAGKDLCNHCFRTADYAGAASCLADLYAEADGERQRALTLMWVHQIAELIGRREAREIPHYLAVRAELFPDDVRSMSVTVDALSGLGQEHRVPEHCARLPTRCFHALRYAGLLGQAIARYGDAVGQESVVWSLVGAGRYEEALAKGADVPDAAARALTCLGRAAEAVARYPDHCQVAYLALGRHQELLDRWPEPSEHQVLALRALGRIDALVDRPGTDSWLWHFARYCAGPEYTVALGRDRQPGFYDSAVLCQALDLLMQGEEDAAVACLDELPLVQSPRFWWMRRGTTDLLLSTVCRGLLGRTDTMWEGLTKIRDAFRYTDRQAIWHDAGFLLGSINAQQYLGQPSQARVRERLQLVCGIAADLSGDTARATAAYRGVGDAFAREPYLALWPLPELHRFLTWRLLRLADQGT